MKFLKLWFISVSQSMVKKRHNIIHFVWNVCIAGNSTKFNRKEMLKVFRLRGWISIDLFVRWLSLFRSRSPDLCTHYILCLQFLFSMWNKRKSIITIIHYRWWTMVHLVHGINVKQIIIHSLFRRKALRNMNRMLRRDAGQCRKGSTPFRPRQGANIIRNYNYDYVK